MFDSVGRINDNLAKNNRKDKGRWRIWTPDGFWRSLSDSRLRPAGRCQWTPCVAPRYNARLPVQSWLLCTVQPVDGQVSGPQVFRKSDHLPHPPPLLNSPSAQNQQRVRKGFEAGTHNTGIWSRLCRRCLGGNGKRHLVRSSKRISRKKCGTQIFWVKWACGETLEIGTNLDSGSILTTIIYSHILQLWSKEYNEGVKIDQLHGTVSGRAEGGQFSGLGSFTVLPVHSHWMDL